MKVNFIDLKTQYISIKDEIDDAIQSVLDSSAFAAGPFVKSFEENFAKVHDAKYCVGVNSGTAALHIAMWALDINENDEVIVPTNTFFATPEAVSLCGAEPVFVDCEAEYFNIDPDRIQEAVTNKTKAIIAVHLYGQPAQLDKIREIAERNNLILIEDCAQAHLAEYKGRPIGTAGLCGCFSFYPGKNLGAYGEAGAVITNDNELYNRILKLRDHGSIKKYHHECIGHNYRMEGMQGAILDVKLRHLDKWTEVRRRRANQYRELLKDVIEITLPQEDVDAKHVYHLFVIKCKNREKLMEFLNTKGVSCGIHYPIPCHLQPAYDFLEIPTGRLPVSEEYAEEILSLPMHDQLTEVNVEYIASQIKTYFRS